MNTFDKTVQSLCFEIDDLKHEIKQKDERIANLEIERMKLMEFHQTYSNENMSNWLQLFMAAKIDRENDIMTVDISKLKETWEDFVLKQ